MAIVWPCPLSVDEYLAEGRDVAVPRADCPGCADPMSFWSGYLRSVRDGGGCRRLWVRRARCGSCRASHVLVPSFCLVGRLDVVEIVGEVIDGVVDGASGVRAVAARVGVPHTTARDWVRRFGRRAAVLAAGFAALAVEWCGWAPTLGGGGSDRRALAAVDAAWAAARSRVGRSVPARWTFAGLVTGGRLLGTNTNPPWSVFGRRRFMPPVP